MNDVVARVHIVINRTDAIGDNVLTLPILMAIKKHRPHWKIFILTSKKAAGLYQHQDFATDVWVWPAEDFSWQEKWKWFKEKIIAHAITHYLYVGGSHMPTLMSKMLKIPWRGGHRSKLFGHLLLPQGVRQHRSRVEHHESVYNLSLIKALIPEINGQKLEDYHPHLTIDGKKAQQLTQQFYSKAQGRKVLVIHPGMTGHTLNWSMAQYARLIQFLHFEWREELCLFISGSTFDHKYLVGLREALTEEGGAEVIGALLWQDELEQELQVTLSLSDYYHLISKAYALLAPSTGPLHVASLLGIKLYAIFSPIRAQSAKRWAPLGEHVLFAPSVNCPATRECWQEKCPDFFCMNSIAPEQVFLRISKDLEKKHR